MLSLRYLSLGLFVFVLCHFCQNSFANNAAYEQRRTDYITNALNNFDNDALTLQAYQGVPLDSAALHDLVSGLPTRGTVDFDLVKLVRILFFTNGANDTLIVPAMNALPYWLTYGDTLHGYWSENHMIQWMSSDWLMHEKYGRAIDSSLDNRLRHYLHLKVDYGFYEFFSSVYSPYCLSGLINLADFAQDAEIKMLATQASQRLLKDILMITNDKGVFYPAAGRNYYGKYLSPYNQNHNHLINLLTGMGPAPGYCSHAGGFLASSTLPVDSIIDSWTSSLDITYHIGHSLDSGFVLNASQSTLDKTIFQWSSGAYFHPEVAAETAQLLTDSNLWHHVDFTPFVQFSSFPIPTIVALSNSLSVASKSSLISEEDVHIFKHKSITLSSVQDFWKGKVGYQQFPCVANVGTTPVFTASGKVKHDWDTRSATNANEHLPYVEQHSNVALLMYRPEPVSSFLPFHNPDVALFFNEADYSEVITDSLWLMGRQGNSYVAVRRHCIGEIDSVKACVMDSGQAWVIMVGDSDMYGSFTNFQTIIHNSQFEARWYTDTVSQELVYYSKIIVDTFTVDYAWGVSTTTTGITNPLSANSVRSYPNPFTNEINLDLAAFKNEELSIRVQNVLGQTVFAEKILSVSEAAKIINTQNWNDGLYVLSIETKTNVYSAKLVRGE